MRPSVPPSEIEKLSREMEKFASEFGEVIIPENIPRCEFVHGTLILLIRTS
jgi:hypothetical protein